MYSVVKSCTSEVRLSKRWNGSTTASTWWIVADKPFYIFGGSEISACPIFICYKIIVPLWIETWTACKWVINVRTRLYAVCLSLSTFSSVVHFRCRLHFQVQTLKGERFSGWILSAGGRFRPKRLAALTFQLSRADVLPSQTSKGKGRMTESGNSYIADLW